MKPYYSKDGIEIFHGDCREVLSAIEAGSFDVVLTDPPYGVQLGRKANNQKFDRKSYATHEDSADEVSRICVEIVPVLLRLASRVVITPGVKNMWLYPKPTHTGAFYYPCATGCNSWGFSNWQPILYYGKDPFGGQGSKHDSLMSTEAAEKNGHPCPKPIGQWQWLMSRTTVEGEAILDPFLGSGTTLVAARLLGRTATGIELCEEYCEIAARRLDAMLPFPKDESPVETQREMFAEAAK